MKKHKFILKKVQRAFVDVLWDEDQTIREITEQLEMLSEEELNFGVPSYHLESIVKEEGKISEVIWESFS